MNEHQQINLYVQVPFCTAKCRFCMWTDKYAVGELTQTGWIPNFISVIQEEIAQYDLGRPECSCHSLCFGGGTPSLLSPGELAVILDSLDRKFAYRKSVRQFSLEATPESVDVHKLRAFRQLGVDRLSIGAQSMNDRLLKQLGRLHTGADVERAYEHSRRAGFENINIDLISAIPGQTEGEWKDDVEAVVALEPDQITAHTLWLNVARHSSLYRSWKTGALEVASIDTRVRMLNWAHERLLESGYRMYMLGYYSKGSKRHLFDINEFRQIDNIVAFGPGAQSHIGGRKYKNAASISDYLKCGGRVERIPTPLSPADFFRFNLLLSPGAVRSRFEKYFHTRLEDAIGADPFLRDLVADSLRLGLSELDDEGFRFKKTRFLDAFFHMWGWDADTTASRERVLLAL